MSAQSAHAWIVVPAFNEASRLPRTLTDVCREYPFVVVVDDGSTDGTVNVALEFPVWVLRHAVNSGQGAALKTGIDFALEKGAEIIVTFDADGQHMVSEIASLIAPIVDGSADVVLGSRFLGRTNGMPRTRRWLLRTAVVLTRALTGLDVTDTHNGLRSFSQFAAHHIRISQNRMSHASEILDEIRRNRLRYCEVPVTIQYSAESLHKGQSGWNAIRILFQITWARLFR